jgi:hypothetical protein
MALRETMKLPIELIVIFNLTIEFIDLGTGPADRIETTE